MSRRRRIGGVVALVVLVGGGVVAVVAPWERGGEEGVGLRVRDFSRAPGWRGLNNRRLGDCVITRQDFGGMGGASIGGLITRNARPAWFGRRVGVGWERPFTASGELVVRGTRDEPFPSGSVMVGFFNSASRDWRPPNLLAFQVNADTVKGGGDYSVSLAYGARDYAQDHVIYGGDERPAGLRFGRPYRWRLRYDPRAAGRRGRATLTIPGAGPAASLALTPNARRAGADLDRFGVANQTMARGEGLDFVVRRLVLGGRAQDVDDSVAGWRGSGNRASFRDCLTGQPNSFGWTGPRDGRVGGLVARTDEQRPEARASYADRVGRLTLEDRLHAQGTVRLQRANSDSASLLGWFRAKPRSDGRREEGASDFLGVAITGPSRVGQYFDVLLVDRRGETAPAKGTGLVFNPGPRTLRWSLDYAPGPQRGGILTVRLGDRRVVREVPRGARRTGATFNRFGLRNLQRGGSFQVVYFDDLRYTVAPKAKPGKRRRG